MTTPEPIEGHGEGARLTEAERLLNDFNAWTPYQSRDTGETYLADSVQELVRDLRIALGIPTQCDWCDGYGDADGLLCENGCPRITARAAAPVEAGLAERVAALADEWDAIDREQQAEAALWDHTNPEVAGTMRTIGNVYAARALELRTTADPSPRVDDTEETT